MRLQGLRFPIQGRSLESSREDDQQIPVRFPFNCRRVARRVCAVARWAKSGYFEQGADHQIGAYHRRHGI